MSPKMAVYISYIDEMGSPVYNRNDLDGEVHLVKDTTGVNLSDVMRANTYNAKVTKNVNVSGLDVSPVVETSDK